MKDRSTPCMVEEQSYLSDFEDDVMECGDLLDLVDLTTQLTTGHVHIYDMADRLTEFLGSAESESEDDDVEEALLVAGYTDCMREALRYLVEEESYSAEHPLVQGLRQHLLEQQARVLQLHLQSSSTSTEVRPPSV